MQVTRKCILRFAINSNFLDEVELDVVPLEISGIVLGSPYLYDREAVFHHHENKCHFFKNGIEYIVRAHKKNMGLSLMHAGQMKRIVNARQKISLMFKHNDVLNETFQEDASNEQEDFIEVANVSNKMFQGSNMLPLKRGKQDEKGLQQSTSVLNSDGNKMSVQESAKVKEKAQK